MFTELGLNLRRDVASRPKRSVSLADRLILEVKLVLSSYEMHVRINSPQNVELLRIERARCQQCLLTYPLTALI